MRLWPTRRAPRQLLTVGVVAEPGTTAVVVTIVPPRVEELMRLVYSSRSSMIRVREATLLIDHLDSARRRAVLDARAEGGSWSLIARALNVTVDDAKRLYHG